MEPQDDAFHHIASENGESREEKEYDVVGPVCETGDTFAKARRLPVLASGDIVHTGQCEQCRPELVTNMDYEEFCDQQHDDLQIDCSCDRVAVIPKRCMGCVRR